MPVIKYFLSAKAVPPKMIDQQYALTAKTATSSTEVPALNAQTVILTAWNVPKMVMSVSSAKQEHTSTSHAKVAVTAAFNVKMPVNAKNVTMVLSSIQTDHVLHAE